MVFIWPFEKQVRIIKIEIVHTYDLEKLRVQLHILHTGLHHPCYTTIHTLQTVNHVTEGNLQVTPLKELPYRFEFPTLLL
jgi:hypothetical protein